MPVVIPATGSGDATPSVATEPIAGDEYQLIKIVTGTVGSTVPVTPLTDTALRATPVPVSGTVTASGPLTDAQLRATAVPVSGTVTASGPLTDTQLRATAVPVSGTVTANAGTNLNTSALGLETTQAAGNVLTGAVTETAPATDTASSGLNGRLQRIAQRLTSIIALLPTALGAGGGLKVDGSGTALPVSGTITAVTAITNALPAGTNAIGKLAANNGVDIGDVDVTSLPALATGTNTIGGVTQTIPTTGTTSAVNDTASSTTLLSSDATRKGFRIWNDSTSTLYVKYGTTASLTDCSVKIAPDGYLEENFYSGRVDGIWSVDASGAARIVSLT